MRPDVRKSTRYGSAALALALVLAAPMAALADKSKPEGADKPASSTPDLKIEKYTLPNGLEVILHEDHTTPIVGVNVWYKVGSKDEKLGRTGFAHLFEHLMFQGSKNHDSEYFGPIEKVGAQINGSTTTDRTNYFETLPSNALELALWLEADRMGFLLPALSQKKLDNQRDVVKNERRQRVDNVPYGQSQEAMLKAMYPEDHPYFHSVIGSLADLSAASLADVSAFFKTYYAPNNASLTIAGDFKPEEAKALVAKFFGSIPRGPAVPKVAARGTTLKEPKHVVMTDRVRFARAQLAWPTVEVGHKDEAPLDVLATVLGQLPQQSRLFKALQYDKQLATAAMAMHGTSMLTGTFNVILSPTPNAKLEQLIEIVDAEIERLKKDGPTADEVSKAKTITESRLIFGLQQVGRKADFLNQYNVYYGDPSAYKKEMADLLAVTPEDVKRVANQYLTANRVRLDVNPGAPAKRAPEVAVKPESQTSADAAKPIEITDSFDRSKMPKLGEPPVFTPPPVVRKKLSNGLEVLVAERHELPILAMSLVIKGGETLVPEGKEGLAELTASLWNQGTKTRTGVQIAAALSDLGASLGAGGGLESSSLSLTTLKKTEDKALELFTDVLLNPTFPEKEFNRIKTQRLAGLMRRGDSAESIAGYVFPKLLYGDSHPYGRSETIASVKALTPAELKDFYKKIVVPNNAALVVAGDTTPDEVVAKLEAALKDWKPGADVAAATLPEVPPGKPGFYFVNKPEAAQSVLAVGAVGVPRKTPDYFAINVMNAILGGQFSSRINLNLREDKGYTYGARSGFSFRQGPGPFEASAPVQTDVTRDALDELVKELNDIGGKRPATAAEIAFAKDRMVKGFPSRFESVGGGGGPRGGGGLTSTLAELVLYNLPDDYFTTYQSKVEAITKADVDRVAKQYIDAGKMTILVVGDREKVIPTLKSLPYAQTIIELDAEGKLVKK